MSLGFPATCAGPAFPLKNLPKALAIATSLNPLTYGVDGLRQSLIGAGHYGMVTDFSVLMVFAVALVVLGSYRFSKIQV
jgi:ABC-2 type transport system permease protein